MSEPAVRRIDRRHGLLAGLALTVAIVALAAVAGFTLREEREAQFQATLEPFYTPPDPLPPGEPGDLLRIEPLEHAPRGAIAWRILYRSQDLHGNDVAASGVVYAPANGQPPPGGRPVVAWAHPTTGMADDCAPSRQEDPSASLDWLEGMIANGWVVTATDYAGLGTPGTLAYLVGVSAAQDVLNSVRAARQIEDAHAGSRFATWGHSEGGHASLWAAVRAPTYASELQLVGSASAAPAAELVALVQAEWNEINAQVLGPYVVAGWAAWYEQLRPEQILTPSALRALPTLAEACLERLELDALFRIVLREGFFTRDPTADADWRDVAQENTPGLVTVPVFIANGTADDVVLPPTTSTLIERYCTGGVHVTADWMRGVGHTGAGNAAGPAATAWIASRFAGEPLPEPCGPADPP